MSNDTKQIEAIIKAHPLPEMIESELVKLINTPTKTELDYIGIDRLSSALLKVQRAVAVAKTGLAQPGRKSLSQVNGDNEDDDGTEPDSKEKPRGKKRERRKSNDISHVSFELLDQIRDELLYQYQRLWHENKFRKNRFILKSRQIGATFYFAWEALDDAIRTGDNQIFLSASRDQAEVFKQYIVAFAQKYFEVELKGKFCITLSNGAQIRFLATNASTAQSYHGHLYIDEVFWIHKFKELKRVADGMASHKKWRKTYFSTPSAMSHPAFSLWSGSEFASNNKISDFDIDTSHETLKFGLLGPDNIWRHMVTVYDAQEQGCDLFDIEELKLDYSDNDFANLFLCKFIDDSQSVFSLAKLMECVVAADEWPDYKPRLQRPFGDKHVSFGFDPSRYVDNASLAILDIPSHYQRPFRALNLHSYHGQNIQLQARNIKDLVDQHNVRHFGIDTTGIGSGIFDLVQDFYPMATPIHYSTTMKNSLVIKALDLIENGRFQYLSTQHEITRAFMMITKTTTSTGQVVYASSRSPNAGHADIAWAIMHAMLAEEINANRKPTQVTFSN